MSQKDFQVVVIGGGPGGYVAAIRAAQRGLKVACIEMRETLGGTCLNEGCIPSKALLQATEAYVMAQTKFKDYGIGCNDLTLNIGQMQKNKERVVKANTKGIELLFKKNSVTFIKGRATLKSSSAVMVESLDGSQQQTVTFDHCIIATGSMPQELASAPFDNKDIVSSTGALDFEEVPAEMVVIGAGVVGLELASVWARAGSKVTILEALPRILSFVDEDVTTELVAALRKEGIKIITSAMVQKVSSEQWGRLTVSYQPTGGEATQILCDKVLVAIGRKPNTAGIGLETLGIKTSARGMIEVNDTFQTAVANVYAIGDAIKGPMLAHKAEEDGVACADIIAGLKAHVDYDKVPSVVYTWPEVAAVGKTSQQCIEQNIPIKVGKFPFIANGRSRSMGESRGFAKLIAHKDNGTLLGAQIIGPHASELVAELTVALTQGMSASALAHICHAHPTLTEVIKEAALDCDGMALHK